MKKEQICVICKPNNVNLQNDYYADCDHVLLNLAVNHNEKK